MPSIRTLSDDLQKVAIEELNEEPERLAEDIRALKTWIDQQPHLKARKDDQFLVAFLRGCKFSLEKAKSKIENFYTLRSKYPEFFTVQNLDSPRVLELIRCGVGLHLPIPLHENGPRIMLIRPGAYSPDKFSFDEVMGIAHTMEQITLLEDDFAVVNGYIDVLDMKDMTPAHFFQATPTVMKKMTIYAEEAMPLRQRASHFINTVSAFDKIFNMLKTIMPEKQQERLTVHGNNLEALYKHIPQKYLPKEYGGANGSIPELIAFGEKKFQEYRQFFLDEKNYGVDEKLRPGKSIDYDNLFGIEGSFRKLNVD